MVFLILPVAGVAVLNHQDNRLRLHAETLAFWGKGAQQAGLLPTTKLQTDSTQNRPDVKLSPADTWVNPFGLMLTH